MTSEVVIETWAGTPEHRRKFAEINREWLREFFWVEPADEAMFEEPETHVLDGNGEIFFARAGGEIIGTIALIPLEDGIFELSKMGVTSKARGLGAGRRLAEALIEAARARGARKLYIASNRKLERAIALYRNLGFSETPCGADQRYQRCDITLELPLVEAKPDPARYGDWEIKGKCVDF